MKPGDILELKPDATDITEGAVEVKVISIEGRNVLLETISTSGVHTPVHMEIDQANAVFRVKRVASE